MTTKVINTDFDKRKTGIQKEFQQLIERKNEPQSSMGNGIFNRYKNPVITADHAPLEWRYDLNKASNPFLMERISINAAFNAGAMKWDNKYLLAVRVEGVDRKSFIAIAESPNGIDNFKFWEKPNQIYPYRASFAEKFTQCR